MGSACWNHHLCVTNIFFDVKLRHRLSWMHPRSKHWHQLDLIITRRSQLNNVRVTRSYHSADCDTDHALVCCKVQSHPKKLHRAPKPAKDRINVDATTIPQKVLTFQELLKSRLENYKELGIEEYWCNVKDVTHEAAMLAFGNSDRRSEDWFNADIAHLQPLIEEKRLALQNYKHNPTSQSLEALREARRRAKEECKKCANV